MKRILAILLALTMAILAGCTTANVAAPGDTSPESAGASSGTAKDTLIVAMETEPSSMNPTSSTLAFDQLYWDACWATLTRYDDDMNLVPYMCESFESIDDTNWRFVMRDNLKFSDGTDITADDIAASIQAAKDSGARSSYAYWYSTITAEDDRTFVLTTTEPVADLLHYLSLINILPKTIIEDENYNYAENPVCSGPYKLLSWSKSNQVTYTANEHFFLEGLPKIPNLTIRIMPEGISRTIALQNGEVDYLVDVQATDIASLQEAEGIEVLEAPYCSPFYMNFNITSVAGGNEYFRKAVSAAINRANASMAGAGGHATPLASCRPMGLYGSTDENAIDTNFEAAKEYIAQSGLSDDDLNVVCVVKEEPFRLALESIQADLQQIGIKMEIRMVDNATYSDLPKSNDYTMSVGKLASPSLGWGFESCFHSTATYNHCHVYEDYVDEMIDKIKSTVDIEEREGLIKEFISYINAKSYVIGIYQMTSVRAYSSKLGGVKLNPEAVDAFEQFYWID